MAFSSIEFDVRKKRINRASSVITLLCQARGFAFETWQNRKGWIQGEGASLASFESWGLSLLKKVFVYICGLKKKRSVKKKPRGGGVKEVCSSRGRCVLSLLCWCIQAILSASSMLQTNTASYFVVNNKLDIGRRHDRKGDLQALCPKVRKSLWIKARGFCWIIINVGMTSFYLLDRCLY